MLNCHGQRKYLTGNEVYMFLDASASYSIEIHTFCCILVFSGCRISEAISLTYDSIDFEAQCVIIKCLKKRGKIVFRAVPLPPAYLKILRHWFQKRANDSQLLWPWSRMTAYRRVREVMGVAGVQGYYASPKGLRHAFGVRAIQADVPLTLIQRWLGHANIKTTAIYTSAIGLEERRIAARMWRSNYKSDKKYCYRPLDCSDDLII